jgi:Ni/Fe-hydrogenase subunit HybB-like protein
MGVIAAGHAGWRRAARLLGAIYLPVVVLVVSLSHLHQSTLGTALDIVPLKVDPRWWSELMPFQFLVSAYAAGLAAVMAEHVFAARFAGSPLRPRALAGFGAILAGVLAVYIPLGLTVSLWVENVLGAIVPFVMRLLPEVRARTGALLAAALLTLGGVVLHRMNVTVFAMRVNSWESYTPALGEVLTTAGVLAATALAYRWLLLRLPIHEDPAPSAPAPAPAASAAAVPAGSAR